MIFSCNLCGNKTHTIIAKKNEIRFNCYGHNKKIIKCSKCNLIQLYPTWEEEQLDKLYQEYSLKKDFKGYKYKKKIDNYIEKYLNKGDRILEIGARDGENLSYFQNKGYNAIGIDKDPSVCDGKVVLNYDFESMPDSQKFDFIYGIHVLEHIRDPHKFINRVNSMLENNGRFLFEIPNVDDPILTIYKNKQYNKFYWYPFHIFFYNKDTITNMFQKVGINISVKYKQRYGLINHMRWFLLGKPGNINFTIPILDYLYKLILTKVFKKSDTLIIVGEKR